MVNVMTSSSYKAPEITNTPGGAAITDLRTVYAYKSDEDSKLGTYEGSAWPYVTTTQDITTIEVPAGISQEFFTKNEEDRS